MNWVENAHQLFLRRKRGMAKFRQSKLLQKFAWAHARIHNPVNQGRHLGSRPYFKALRAITSERITLVRPPRFRADAGTAFKPKEILLSAGPNSGERSQTI